MLHHGSEMPLSLQPTLLRVLQDHRVEHLGATQAIAVDFRNHRRDEPRSGRGGRGRHVPAGSLLSPERLSHYAARAAALQQHAYPGNVRELEHVIARALVLSQGRVILPDHPVFEPLRRSAAPTVDVESLLALPFHESVAWEKPRIGRALQESAGSKTDAARRLGIHRRLPYEKIQKLGLDDMKANESSVHAGLR